MLEQYEGMTELLLIFGGTYYLAGVKCMQTAKLTGASKTIFGEQTGIRMNRKLNMNH
jgi:hypothetical protein